MTNARPTYAVTVLGRDRPGIVAQTTGLLGGLGLNLEDSSMTLLRGHFAMTLVCAGAGPGAAAPEEVAAALAPLRDSGLDVSVREVPAPQSVSTVGGTPWVLTVHGGDRPGIVSSLIGAVAAAGGNVTDLTTRLAGDLYLLIAEVDLPDTAAPVELQASIAAIAGGLGVLATLRPADVDEL